MKPSAPRIYRGMRWPRPLYRSIEEAVRQGAPSFSAVVVRLVARAVARGELPKPPQEPERPTLDLL